MSPPAIRGSPENIKLRCPRELIIFLRRAILQLLLASRDSYLRYMMEARAVDLNFILTKKFSTTLRS